MMHLFISKLESHLLVQAFVDRRCQAVRCSNVVGNPNSIAVSQQSALVYKDIVCTWESLEEANSEDNDIDAFDHL